MPRRQDAEPDRPQLRRCVERRNRFDRRGRCREFGVVVERHHHPSMTERGRPVAPARHTPVALQPEQGAIGPPSRELGDPPEVLRPGALVHHHHVSPDPGLAERRADRRAGFVRPVEGEQDDVGVVRAKRRGGGARDVALSADGMNAHGARINTRSASGAR